MLGALARHAHFVGNVLGGDGTGREDDYEALAAANGGLDRPIPVLPDGDIELVDPGIDAQRLQIVRETQRKRLVTARIAKEVFLQDSFTSASR